MPRWLALAIVTRTIPVDDVRGVGRVDRLAGDHRTEAASAVDRQHRGAAPGQLRLCGRKDRPRRILATKIGSLARPCEL